MIITADATPIPPDQVDTLLRQLNTDDDGATDRDGGVSGLRLGLDGPGHLLWPGRSGPVILSPAALRRLSCEADTTIVLRDDRGAIVGILSDHRLATNTQRDALYARDRHCRFPGCTTPASQSIAHHVTHWPQGPTHLQNLALLCPAHHWTVHHDGWQMTIDDHAVCTFTRGRRTYRTHPAEHLRLQPERGPRSEPGSGSERGPRPERGLGAVSEPERGPTRGPATGTSGTATAGRAPP